MPWDFGPSLHNDHCIFFLIKKRLGIHPKVFLFFFFSFIFIFFPFPFTKCVFTYYWLLEVLPKSWMDRYRRKAAMFTQEFTACANEVKADSLIWIASENSFSFYSFLHVE